MTFDKSKVYTALNAEELEVGSEVILANYLESLKQQVEANSWPTYAKRLDAIMGTSSTNRFKSGNRTYNLAYFVRKAGEAEPEDERWVVYLRRSTDGDCHLTASPEYLWEAAQMHFGAKTELFVGTKSEAEEWYAARQKFAEVIKAWEDGKTIQIRCSPVDTWTECVVAPEWSCDDDLKEWSVAE